ncbi:hypothetical protein M3Y99_00981000 [Aphelenchoides fujianensis]|nr:hypothetical protein M3Y99_00981000 [Aphelenchoides fujianensis]
MYRQQILERLERRDRRTAQFVRLISALTVQSELLNFILTEGPLVRQRKRTLSECAADVEVDALSRELADVYKRKSVNDQQLIDVQTEIARKELEIASLSNRNNLLTPSHRSGQTAAGGGRTGGSASCTKRRPAPNPNWSPQRRRTHIFNEKLPK